MQILVTGGAGFIGSNFIRYMMNKYPPYKIVNLDKLTYCGNLNNLLDVEKNPNYRFIKGDVCNKSDVKEAIKDCDTIVHFAAETHVDKSIVDPDTFIKTDVFGTYTLLQEALEHKIKKFVHISTDEVYGSVEKGSSKENDELKPRNPYAASKASAELLAYSFFATYGLPVVITRSSNNYGPYQYPEKIVPLFTINALQDKKLPLYGDGLNKRDWLYVMDNCKAIDLILHKGKNGEIYNIGGNNEKTNLEVTKIILSTLNKSDSLIEYVKDRPGHDKRYFLSNAKINKLGWKPEANFEQTMKETILWYKNNEWWWKPLINKSG